MRLAETVKAFLTDSPYYFKQTRLQEFHNFIKKEKLDPGESFELMRQRDFGEMSRAQRKQSYNECAAAPRTTVRQILKYYVYDIWKLHGDRHRQILQSEYNKRLYDVAKLSEQGYFQAAESLATSPLMEQVIMLYRLELCNEFGILKAFEQLPTWQQLPLAEKQAIADNINLQDQMNVQLQAEIEAINNDAIHLADPQGQDQGGATPAQPPITETQPETPDKIVDGDKILDDILADTKPGEKTKGPSKQFKREGGEDKGLEDFEKFKPDDLKDYETKNGPVKVGKLADGRTIIFRKYSQYGSPTLEIQSKKSNKVIKIRYT